MAAWGIGEVGARCSLHPIAGSKEGHRTTTRPFFQDMRARGLGDLLIVALGMTRPAEHPCHRGAAFPVRLGSAALAHRHANMAVKVPADLWPEFKARVTACYQAPSRAIATRPCPRISSRLRHGPAERDGLLRADDLEACIRPPALARDAPAGNPDHGCVGQALFFATGWGSDGAWSPAALWFERAGDHVAKSGEEDAIPAAPPSQSLLVCGVRVPGPLRSWALCLRPLAPGADKAAIGCLGLGHEGPLRIAQSLDAVIPGATGVCRPAWKAGRP